MYYIIRYNNNNYNNYNNHNNNNNKLPKAVTVRVSKEVEHPYLKKFAENSSSWPSHLEVTGEGVKTGIWRLYITNALDRMSSWVLASNQPRRRKTLSRQTRGDRAI